MKIQKKLMFDGFVESLRQPTASKCVLQAGFSNLKPRFSILI